MINTFKKRSHSEPDHDHFVDLRRVPCLTASFRSSTATAASSEFAICRGPFCALVHRIPEGEALCRRVHSEAEAQAHESGRAAEAVCPFGLSTVAIPVTVRGDRAAGTVFAGEVRVGPPQDEAKWRKKLKECLGEAADGADVPQLWNAYCRTPVLTTSQFRELSKAFEGVVAELESAVASAGRSHPTRPEEEIDQAIEELQENPDGETRVKAQAAESILLDNLTAHIGKQIRYLRLKNLGLGIYSVWLADPDAKPLTLLVK